MKPQKESKTVFETESETKSAAGVLVNNLGYKKNTEIYCIYCGCFLEEKDLLKIIQN